MDQLIIIDKRPMTTKGEVGVVMLHKAGETVDSRWFDYVMHDFGETQRIEWEKDTMSVVLPPQTADFLLRRNWARLMTEPEVQAYNRLGNEPAPAPAPQPKKGDQK
jgi:hypothetical protein